jgi:hypothetical protein
MTVKTDLPDGLYCVETPYLCAGFVVERGHVTRCAPILRRRLAYWSRQAARAAKAANGRRPETKPPNRWFETHS